MSHYHVWVQAHTTELSNAVFDNEEDAVEVFIGVVSVYDEVELAYDDVVEAMAEARGMYAGTMGYSVVISNCDTQCSSPTWN